MVTKKGSNIIPNVFLVFLCLLCVIPFLLIIMSSVTDEKILLTEGYHLFPKKISLLAYQYLLSGSSGTILQGYGNSILITVCGTLLGVALCTLLAYPLSNPELPGRNLFMFILIFTMLFNGGVVSSYMMWTQTFHIKNTLAALIFPNLLLNAFSVILVRSYFISSIPGALYESARLDGASEFSVFLKIALPLSTPILATVAFMQALTYWNDWTNALYYVTDASKYGIQSILNKMLSDATFLNSSEGAKFAQMTGVTAPSTSIRMAVAVMGLLPVLIAYPFFQKYLIQGISLGGVKG